MFGKNGKNHVTFMALIDIMLQKGHSSYLIYHLTKMAANINSTSQKRYLTKMAADNVHYWFFEVL